MMGLMWLSEYKTCSASGSVFNYWRRRCRSAFSIHQSQHRTNAAHHQVSCRARFSEKQLNETSFNLCGGTCVIRAAVHDDEAVFIRRKSMKIFTDTSYLNGVFITCFHPYMQTLVQLKLRVTRLLAFISLQHRHQEEGPQISSTSGPNVTFCI